MSSAIAGLRQYTVSCPSCGTAVTLEEGGTDAARRTCAGCGSPLVIVKTETMFMAAIPAPLGTDARRAAGAGASPADIAEFWKAMVQRGQADAG